MAQNAGEIEAFQSCFYSVYTVNGGVIPFLHQFNDVQDSTYIGITSPVYHRDKISTDTVGVNLKANLQQGKSFKSMSVKPPSPIIVKNIQAQPASSQYTPNDNSMAINKNGIIVTCINSSIYFYDSLGNNIRKSNFTTLTGNSFSGQAFYYDPRIIYDPFSDRFVLVVLYGQNSTNSHVVLCVSETNDPLGKWFVYSWNGGFGINGLWFDYPQISANNSHIYITGNMFNDNNVFYGTTILAIEKSTIGFNKNISYLFFNNISGNPSGLCPVKLIDENSEAMYFCSTYPGGDEKLYIYKISNDNKLTYSSIKIGYYGRGENAIQPGTNDFLETGGNRIRDSYLRGGVIHIVFSANIINYSNQIIYIRADIDNYYFKRSDLYFPNSYMAYPSISPVGMNQYNHASIIGFLYSSHVIFPSSYVIFCSHEMIFSDTVIVQSGLNNINIKNGDERWGDYTSMQSFFSSDKSGVWFFSSYATNNSLSGNTISKISMDSLFILPNKFGAETFLNLYPNPASNQLQIDLFLNFSEAIYLDCVDYNGKVWKVADSKLFLREGITNYLCDVSSLSDGVYFIRVMSEKNSIIASKKWVKISTP